MIITNQSELFDYIWSTRPHVSELSGLPLAPQGSDFWFWQFAHIVSKGADSFGKLDPENIVLLLPEEHHLYDSGSTEDNPDYKFIWEKRELLKQKYNHMRRSGIKKVTSYDTSIL